VGETAQTGGATSEDAYPEALGIDACPPPTQGDPCSADAAVCFANSCCGIYWVCTDGQWAYGIPCPCIYL
jgi:hypothetical protein